MNFASLQFQKSLNDLRASNATLNRTLRASQLSLLSGGPPGTNTKGSNNGAPIISGGGGVNRDPVSLGCFKYSYTVREEREIYHIKFSRDDDYIAVAFGDGSIHIYQPHNGNLISKLEDPATIKVPCTSMSWRPMEGIVKTKNVLIAAYADGRVLHWHTTTGQILTRILEGENQVLCVDYASNASRFVTAGSDCTLRIYDEKTRHAIALFAGKGDRTAGHSNRIFAVKFHPRDPHLLISGGWDNTIEIWDSRLQYAVRSIYGPHVCGDSIDFDDTGEKVLTGSYQKDNQLQVWSYGTAQLIETIPWNNVDDKKPCLLYSAQYTHGSGSPNKFILAGGGGPVNEAKLFNTNTRKCVGLVQNFQQALYTTAISRSEKFAAFGGTDKALYVYEIDSVPLSHMAEFNY